MTEVFPPTSSQQRITLKRIVALIKERDAYKRRVRRLVSFLETPARDGQSMRAWK